MDDMKRFLANWTAKVGFVDFFANCFILIGITNKVKKKPEGFKRAGTGIISTLPRLNAATNARAKQQLELLQSNGKKYNTIGSISIKENAE